MKNPLGLQYVSHVALSWPAEMEPSVMGLAHAHRHHVDPCYSALSGREMWTTYHHRSHQHHHLYPGGQKVTVSRHRCPDKIARYQSWIFLEMSGGYPFHTGSGARGGSESPCGMV
ncbi:hypothetical protein LguiA_021124 [Lonicera macranthoides]